MAQQTITISSWDSGGTDLSVLIDSALVDGGGTLYLRHIEEIYWPL